MCLSRGISIIGLSVVFHRQQLECFLVIFPTNSFDASTFVEISIKFMSEWEYLLYVEFSRNFFIAVAVNLKAKHLLSASYELAGRIFWSSSRRWRRMFWFEISIASAIRKWGENFNFHYVRENLLKWEWDEDCSLNCMGWEASIKINYNQIGSYYNLRAF